MTAKKLRRCGCLLPRSAARMSMCSSGHRRCSIQFSAAGRRNSPEAGSVQIAYCGTTLEVDDMVVAVDFNPLGNKARLRKFEARLVAATNYSQQKRYRALCVSAETDNTVRLQMPNDVPSIKAQKGIIHLAVQTRSTPQHEWRYEYDAAANVRVFVQKDLPRRDDVSGMAGISGCLRPRRESTL